MKSSGMNWKIRVTASENANNDIFQQIQDQYKGTHLEGLDAFDRQLKRFEITSTEDEDEQEHM